MALQCCTFLHLSPFLIPTHAFLPTLLGLVILTINTKPAASNDFLNNHSCSSNFTFTPSGTYDINLKALLSTLSHEARFTHFHNTTVGGGQNANKTPVYGLFMCRGDVSPSYCQECTERAVQDVISLCSHMKEAIIWYDECMLRYSYRNFFGSMEEWPRHHWKKPGQGGDDEGLIRSRCFYTDLGSLLEALMAEAPMAPEMFALKEVNACHNTTLYGFAQCTPDLSTDNCSRCLRDAAAGIHTLCCDGGIGERFVFPSCIIRYEIYAFAFDSGRLPTTPTNRRKEIRTQKIAIIVVVLVMVSMILFCLSCFFLRTRARSRKCRKAAILRENFGDEVTPWESLQYDLVTIDAATNKFSDENLIGRGGFGQVYKGILSDNQEIAIKKLSTSSRQGGDEFKNEVLLIAKLQHRNLVRLLGFCLDGKERMLIYEYVPNGSLDYFLFDSRQKKKQLTWCERYKIIEGIARGILYLHEDSRLKVIHRDIKPSNILLDNNMNPKISDFGMARMIVADHPQKNTNKIVGTYGYMSPEYAMHGKFSIKSDVFSFGVMILEIISGKKNSYSFESSWMGDLLNYAWKQWMDHAPLELLDPTLKVSSYSENEVVKCIHIGLLCVQENPDYRPTIATVASYLSNLSAEMPFPQEPAFVMRGRVEPDIVGKGSSSSHPINGPVSFNEMTISNSLPR